MLLPGIATAGCDFHPTKYVLRLSNTLGYNPEINMMCLFKGKFHAIDGEQIGRMNSPCMYSHSYKHVVLRVYPTMQKYPAMYHILYKMPHNVGNLSFVV